MAKSDLITAAPSHDRTQFRDLQVADILTGIKMRIEVLDKQANQIQAVSYGGAALNGKIDEHGVPCDITNLEIFNVITDLANQQYAPMCDVEEMLCELTLRAAATS